MDKNPTQDLVEQVHNGECRVPNSVLEECADFMAKATMNELPATLNSVLLATLLHRGQTRKNGEPFITHPVRVSRLLFSNGIRDDVTLASALLHDVLEECGEVITVETLGTDFGVDSEIAETVECLTKHKGLADAMYYAGIAKSPRATLVKLADRTHNLATMVGVYSPEKIHEYIRETEQYVIPLCQNANTPSMKHAQIILTLEQQIRNVIDYARWVLSRTLSEQVCIPLQTVES